MFVTAVFIIDQDLMEKLDHVIFYIPVVPDWILVDNIFASRYILPLWALYLSIMFIMRCVEITREQRKHKNV